MDTVIISTVAAIALLVIDWLQTRCIANNPSRFYEINTILGKHPSVRAVNTYFACCIAVTLTGSIFIPFWWAICALLIVLETFVTIRNYMRGIRFA